MNKTVRPWLDAGQELLDVTFYRLWVVWWSENDIQSGFVEWAHVNKIKVDWVEYTPDVAVVVSITKQEVQELRSSSKKVKEYFYQLN